MTDNNLINELIDYWDQSRNVGPIYELALRFGKKDENNFAVYLGPDYNEYLLDFAQKNGPFIFVEQVKGDYISEPQIIFPWMQNDIAVFEPDTYDGTPLSNDYDGSGWKVLFLGNDFIVALKHYLRTGNLTSIGFYSAINKKVI